MPAAADGAIPLDRPAFMVVLGLLPPYELEDIKAAYRAKALVAHPDKGGDPADFMRLKDAYDQAVEYSKFHGSRRAWIAAQVEQYVRQEEVIAEVLRRGGRVEIERLDWIEKSWGEGFSHLADRLRHIYVRGMTDGDTFLEFLATQRPPYLVGLDVSGSRVSGPGLRRLADFEILRWLDVSGTNVDRATLQALLSNLPSLERLNVRKTRLGWLGRWKLRRPQLRVVTDAPPDVTPGTGTVDLRHSIWQV